MDRVAVDGNGRPHDLTVFVLRYHGLLDAPRTALDCLVVRVARVVHPQRDVAHAVAVLVDVGCDRTLGAQR